MWFTDWKGGAVDMMFLDILKACGANFDWNQTLSGFGLSPPQTFLQILKRWGFWWLLRGRALEDTAGVAKTLDPLLPAQEWLSPRLEVAQQFGNLKKGTINDTSRRFTITEEKSRTTAVAQSQITA